MTEMAGELLIGAAMLIANILILALNFKLYTEFAKQRMQEARRERHETGGKNERTAL